MHGTLFIGISRRYAKTGLAARKLACEYLDEEGFTPIREFGGVADYFSVGGRWSGALSLLKLKDSDPKHFARFWRQFHKLDDSAHAKALFRKFYPKYLGRIPACRDAAKIPDLGFADDTMVIDKALFNQLRQGLASEFYYSWGLIEKPCALYRDWDEDRRWPEVPDEIIGKIWIVLIDYHY